MQSRIHKSRQLLIELTRSQEWETWKEKMDINKYYKTSQGKNADKEWCSISSFFHERQECKTSERESSRWKANYRLSWWRFRAFFETTEESKMEDATGRLWETSFKENVTRKAAWLQSPRNVSNILWWRWWSIRGSLFAILFLRDQEWKQHLTSDTQ